MRILGTITILAFVLAACGGDDGPPPFVVQINSRDVVQTAVNRIELVLDPEELDRRFEMVPDRSIGGEVFTRVSAAGEYVITLEQGYITRNGQPGEMFPFLVRVPLQGSPVDNGVADPTLRVTFIRGEERIGIGERFLAWPLAPGGEAVVTVQCIRPTFARQCTNNDGADAGPAPVDSGTDAGSTVADGG